MVQWLQRTKYKPSGKDNFSNPKKLPEFREKKSRIRETKHLSTDADSSTNTTIHSGPQLIPEKNSNSGGWHFNLFEEMLKFSIMTSWRLITISLCRKLGGAWGVLGWILDMDTGKERNYMLSLSEVQWSLLELKVFQSFGRHLMVF